MILDRTSVASQITKLLTTASTLKVAIAFWGAGSAKLLKPIQGKAVELLCNLESGACNPDEVEVLTAMFPGAVKSNPSLHAKVWWTPAGLILGSSNASANGLALEASELAGWHEANVLLTDKETIDSCRQWFDGLWGDAASQLVDDRMLADAKVLWQRRRFGRATARSDLADTNDFLTDLRLKPEAFSDRSIFVSTYRWESDADIDELVDEQARHLGADPDLLDVYRGWHWDDDTRLDGLPEPGAAILDFDTKSSEWGVYVVLDAPPTMHHEVPLIWVRRSRILVVGDVSYDLTAAADDLRDAIQSVPGARNNYLPLEDFGLALSGIHSAGRTMIWREYVRDALGRLGGEAKLSDIYAEVRRLRREDGRTLPRHLAAVVRKELELNSPDSQVYANRDWFRMARSRGEGVWRLTRDGEL